MVHSYELTHYGILGMKWGRHKAKQEAYRQKIKTLAGKENLVYKAPSDYFRFTNANKSMKKRLIREATLATLSKVGADMMLGKNYLTMSKKQIIKKGIDVTATTAGRLAQESILTRSAASKYTDKGNLKKGKKHHILTKEDIAESAIAVTKGIIIMNAFMKKYVRDPRNTRAEERMKRWGSNLLASEAGKSVLWTNGNMAILDR